MTEVARGRLAAAVPFALSLGLSIATVGGTVHWQDSGFFLCAVKEAGVLYPPGYVLYVLLARAWTLVFFFVDFTWALHLFSSACAAAGAATLGRAAAALLRSRGRLFRVAEAGPGPCVDVVGAAIGCMAAAGYTFWFAGIYAKGYALYFLVLALLLRWMIRADESGRPRDFTVAAALIGLAWQAHPSATLAGLAFLLFVVLHARTLGWAGVAGRAALAAACAAGPVLLLPLLAAGDPVSAFGDPRSAGELLEYFTGRRFVARQDSFGWEPERMASVFRYGWEEFLGIGLLLVAAGGARLARSGRRFLFWVLAWVVPLIEVTVLFQIEGQHDFWFTGAWLPLWLVAAVGLHEAAGLAGRHGAVAAAAIGAAGAAWSVAANAGDLSLRGYGLAEVHARVHVESLEDDAILLVHSDDAAAGIHYLQLVRGVKPGLLLVRAGHLERGRSGEPGWYDRKLLRREPALRMPDYRGVRDRLKDQAGLGISAAAFLEANADLGRPIYLLFELPASALPEGRSLTPAGGLWKLTRWPEDPDPRHWEYPVTAESVAAGFRRERGQRSAEVDLQDRLLPEAYERRLLVFLLAARRNLADWNHERGGWREAARLYGSILELDPVQERDAVLQFRLGDSLSAMGEAGRAETILERSLGLGLPAVLRASAHVRLAEILRSRGEEEEARLHLERAESVRSIPDDVRERLLRMRGVR